MKAEAGIMVKQYVFICLSCTLIHGFSVRDIMHKSNRQPFFMVYIISIPFKTILVYKRHNTGNIFYGL